MKKQPYTGHICSECGQKPLSDVLNNSRGHTIGMFCTDCYAEGKKLIDKIAGLHGAYIVDGRYLSSPVGTPDVRSLKEARDYLARRGNTRAAA